jgi:hypothetical protein
MNRIGARWNHLIRFRLGKLFVVSYANRQQLHRALGALLPACPPDTGAATGRPGSR